MSIEEHWNYHSILEQKYWQELKEHKSHHPMEELQTISFPTFTIDHCVAFQAMMPLLNVS